jgi:hypothetical protein
VSYLGQALPYYDPTNAPVPQLDAERFNGNSSTTIFTMLRQVASSTDVDIFVNNVRQEPQTAYTVSNKTLTFSGAPSTGTGNIYLVYRNSYGAQNFATIPDGSISLAQIATNLKQFETQTLTGDGSTTAFTLSTAPSNANSIILSIDGVIQNSTANFSIAGAVITFTSAPANGAVIVAKHLGFRTGTQSYTLLAGSVGTTELADNSVTAAKIAPGTIIDSDLADDAVTTAKILDANVTTAKIADDAVTTAKIASSVPLGTKNLIINGNMQIAQRATSVAGITATNYHTTDRWKTEVTTAGTWTQTQDTDVPSGQGFAESLKMDCTTADASLDAGDRIFIGQRLEGFNVQSLAKGTATAKSTTLSFWVKSNKTGTYIAELFDSPNARQIATSYTISVADTWEKKTITYAGDTSGVFANDNGVSLMVQFWLAAGSNYTSGTLNTSWAASTNANRAVGQVNLADNTANYINITGVQLEVGTTATDFEQLQYGQQLALCQRYYYKWNSVTSNNFLTYAMAANTTTLYGILYFPTTMRSNPSAVDYGSGWGWWLGGGLTSISAVGIGESGNSTVNLTFNTTGVTAEKMYGILPGGATNYVALTAEL